MIFLSILIPCHNYDCTELVCELYIQSSLFYRDIEIIVGDDCSTQKIIDLDKIRQRIVSLGLDFVGNKVKVITSMSTIDTNANCIPLGAGKMRNLLSYNSNGKYLLFLDSDVMPIDRQFLKKYIDNIDNSTANSVITGGFCYDKTIPCKNYLLKYYYGHNIETKSLGYRKSHRYNTFISMNFLVRRDIYERNPMHDIVSMGYEDALWASTLKGNNVDIHHIDNPVLHNIKENNRQFLYTTYRYVDNLRLYKEFFPKGTVRLLDLYNRIYIFHPLLKIVSSILTKPMERLLLRYPKKIRLFLFLKLLRIFK